MSFQDKIAAYWEMIFAMPEPTRYCRICGHKTTNTLAGQPICGYEDEGNIDCSEVWHERQIRDTWIREADEDNLEPTRAADYGYDPYREEQYNDYRSYINSYDWQVKADIMKRKAMYICQQCGKKATKKKLHVHHRHYKTLFHERIGDLEVLCDKCHAKRHGK